MNDDEGQAKRMTSRGGKGRKRSDVPGAFTIVAVPGTHRDRTKSRFGGRNRSGTGTKRLDKAEKQKIMLEARVQGASWREAAKRAGYRSIGSAWAAAQEAIAAIPEEAAQEVRVIEAERLDAIVKAFWRDMTLGEPDAAHVILRAIERRAKLFGLDQIDPSQAAVLDAATNALAMRLLAMTPDEMEEEDRRLADLLDADRDRRTPATPARAKSPARRAKP